MLVNVSKTPCYFSIFLLISVVSSNSFAIGETTRVSVSSVGGQGDFFSGSPLGISANGRYVAFSSTASNLVANDTNGNYDVFVHDGYTKNTTRVSVGTGGIQANGWSNHVSISADGRYLAFASNADNLVVGDTNNASDVFVYDIQTKQTKRVSVNSNGMQGNSYSGMPSLSADGRFVAFESSAHNLVVGDTNLDSDIFVHDRLTKQTTRISVDSNGVQADIFNSVFNSVSS